MVVEDTLDDLRPATVDDVGAIVQLIEPLESDGTLVPRGRSVIERDVEKFTVLEHDGVIYGCVAVIPYISESMAEMACLIVQQEWQGTRSEEHTSELQSLMRISYAVFCLKKKKYTHTPKSAHNSTIHRKDK